VARRSVPHLDMCMLVTCSVQSRACSGSMQVRNRDLRRAAVPALHIVPILLYFPYDTIAPGGASFKAIWGFL
jgi:hypothetical protein